MATNSATTVYEHKSQGGNSDAPSLMVSREASTLRQQATDILRKAIIEHRFAPGTHLVERELCEMLGVSRTSVREALRHLESEALITMVPHKGPVAADLSVEDAKNIYEVRAALEGMAGGMFAKNATQEMVDDLKAVAEEIREASKDVDPSVILPLISRFFGVIFDGAGNEVCTKMIMTLNSRVWILRRLSLTHPGRSENMMAEVDRILNAADARDPEAMRLACTEHVQSAASIVISRLEKK